MGQTLDGMSDRLKGTPTMEKISLTALAREHLETARAASSGRSAHTVYGGHEHSLRQTLMAMTAGSTMDDHESPGEATLQVLQGRVRVTNSTSGWDGSPGDHIILPRDTARIACDRGFGCAADGVETCWAAYLVAQDVDDVALGVGEEEPPHPPFLVAERMDDP